MQKLIVIVRSLSKAKFFSLKKDINLRRKMLMPFFLM
nr:MAG TPA: hypothetical protein [Caudoviricetes sp.]